MRRIPLDVFHADQGNGDDNTGDGGNIEQGQAFHHCP
jgi:hypothetical protein